MSVENKKGTRYHLKKNGVNGTWYLFYKTVPIFLIACLLIGCGFQLTRTKSADEFSYEHEALLAWESAGRNYEDGKYEAALKNYQEFLKTYPHTQWNEMAYYFIAQCHHKMKQADQALQAYRQVIEKYPASVWADLARERMIELEK